MDIPIKKIAAELLKDIEKRKTPECLDVDILGEFIEQTLPSEDWDKVETHLRSCLYCLNELVELREMLFLEQHAEPLPPALERKLRLLATQKEGGAWATFLDTLKEYFLSAQERLGGILNSKYTWQTVSAILLLAVLVKYPALIQRKPEDATMKVAAAVSDSIVTVRGTDAKGTMVRQGTGVIVDSKRGLIALPLHLLKGITSGEVSLKSGGRFPIKGLIVAPDRDLAVVQVDAPGQLKAAKLADPGTIQTGERIIAISQVVHGTPSVADGVLGDVVPLNPPTRTAKQKATKKTEPSRAVQFVLVGSTDKGIRQAVLVNDKGEVISINGLSPAGEKTGLALPIDDIKRIIESPGAVTPLGELAYKSHPIEAVWYYAKGLLAYDSNNIDEAIGYYEKCLQIDDSYDPAHVLLGEMYYLKGDYEKEMFHYKEAIKLNPGNADAHFDLAQSYEDHGQYDMAIQEFEQVLAIKPRDEETRYNLGVDYLVIGRPDKAHEQYDALKEIHEGAANKLKRIIDLAPPTR